jgi:DNA-binding NarL/FixJ family response regulator
MTYEINEQEFLKYHGKRNSAITIAKHLDVDYAVLILWMIEHDYKPSFSRANPTFEKKAVQLWQSGYTDKEIADAMNVKRDTITGWRHRRGLSPHKRNNGNN